MTHRFAGGTPPAQRPSASQLQSVLLRRRILGCDNRHTCPKLAFVSLFPWFTGCSSEYIIFCPVGHVPNRIAQLCAGFMPCQSVSGLMYRQGTPPSKMDKTIRAPCIQPQGESNALASLQKVQAKRKRAIPLPRGGGWAGFLYATPPPQVLKDSWGVGRIRTGCSRPPGSPALDAMTNSRAPTTPVPP